MAIRQEYSLMALTEEHYCRMLRVFGLGLRQLEEWANRADADPEVRQRATEGVRELVADLGDDLTTAAEGLSGLSRADFEAATAEYRAAWEADPLPAFAFMRFPRILDAWDRRDTA
jgi:hypothetical protein